MKICTRCSKENKMKGTLCGSCRVARFRANIKAKALEYLGNKCSKCGYEKCKRALQFHHTDPSEKDFGISGSENRSWDKVKAELDKCILVCANCHMEIHEEIENNKRATLVDVVTTLV